MTDLTTIFSQYKIDTNKENFPLNTIRILYLILIETLADNPQEKNQKMLEALPVISTILKKRSEAKTSENQKITDQLQLVKTDIDQVQKISGVNLLKVTEYSFAVNLNIQDQLLLTLLTQTQNPDYIFSAQDVIDTLNLRAMDSLIYSELVCELIAKHQYNLSIHYITNLLYQYNDIIDSIVFAKQDIESNNFSPFEIIKRSAKSANEGKKMLSSVLAQLDEKVALANLPQETNQLITEFISLLKNLIGEIKIEQTSEQSANES